MEYQKIINLLDNKPNQPTKFWKNSWVEINDESCGMYNTIKSKTMMLKTSWCDYSITYVLVKGTITVEV